MTGGQYSLMRLLLGVTLAAFWGIEAVSLFGGPFLSAAPGWWPDPFELAESGYWSGSLAVLAGVLSLLLAIGAWDRWFAVAVAYLLVSRAGMTPWYQASPGSFGLLALLLWHAFQPSAPYLSWQARDRIDPDGGWRPAGGGSSGWQFGLWAILWLAYLLFAVFAFLVTEVDDGEALPVPKWLGVLAILFLIGVAFRPSRPVVWGLLLFVQFLRLVWLDPGLDAAGMMVWHAFVFHPKWVRPAGDGTRHWLFYDGHCGLCHRFVRFLLAEDVDGRGFRFAPLQSTRFLQTVPEERRVDLPDSIVLVVDDQLLVKSEATHTILRMLGGAWRVLGECIRVVPQPFRDLVYDGVARVRRRIFGEPADVCPLIPEHLRSRFET